jgi:hypothetical protein
LSTLGKRSSRRWAFIALSLVLAGFLVFPVIAFYTGKALAGPYEGPYGVLGFLINIFGDMSRGNWAAATLLATPAIIFIIWGIALRLRQILAQTPPLPDT